MVFFTRILCYAKAKKIPRKYLRSGFIDSLRLHVRAGSGGNGLPKFGGVGGQGGSVYFVAKEDLSLENIQGNNQNQKVIAKHGRDSSQNFILGVPGENVLVDVPVGISVFTDDGEKLGELNVEGEKLLVAKGGTGGHSKNGYLGKQGQSHSINLDLKLISDIGLVGFPNAGKSTLLKAVSEAKPRIADYPFTTIRPNVGVMSYKDFRQISMADLPGLIEGAHRNIGMGHKFLKHVERTKLILMVVDVNGFQLSPRHVHRDCLDTIVLLNKELEMYNADLLMKPAMIVVNKMDTEGAHQKFDAIRKKIQNIEETFCNYPEELRPEVPVRFHAVMAISAKEGGAEVENLKVKLRGLLDALSQDEADQGESVQDLRFTNCYYQGVINSVWMQFIVAANIPS